MLHAEHSVVLSSAVAGQLRRRPDGAVAETCLAQLATALSAGERLANVRGAYQRVKGDRLVFVITGSALNGSAVPVKSVRVEGRIVGATEERQVVFCGAAPREVTDLSVREIALLQTLEPPKEWTLAPGEQANFLIAFTEPPAELREFAAQVVAVQAPPRRGGSWAGPPREARRG